MPSLNSWTLIGYAKYCETKTTTTGKLKTSLQVSTQEGTKDKPLWVRNRVVCWDNAIAQTIIDGDEVICTGKARTDEWEKDGVKKHMTYMLASAVGKCKDGKIGAVSPSAEAPSRAKAFGEPPAELPIEDDLIPF